MSSSSCYLFSHFLFITARVRSTTGRYCFHRCLSVHRGGEGWVRRGGRGGSAGGRGWVSRGGGVGQQGGGVGQPGGGGVGQVQLGGEGWVRSSRGGGVGQVQPGGEGWVRSSRGEGWVRSSRGGGVGQVQPGGGRGGSAKIAQHRKYLLHGGRYASCVHAGGLSCIFSFFYRFHFS